PNGCPAAPSEHTMTASRFGWTFALTSLAWFVFALDRLVVTTALPVISADLDADLAGTEWVVSAYTLTFAVLLLTGAACSPRGSRSSRWARSPRPSPRRWRCWWWRASSRERAGRSSPRWP